MLGFNLCIVHSRSFDKCITNVITCIHHYRVLQKSSTTLKIPRALPIHPSVFLPEPQATTVRLPKSIVVSFPECHRTGIIR